MKSAAPAKNLSERIGGPRPHRREAPRGLVWIRYACLASRFNHDELGVASPAEMGRRLTNLQSVKLGCCRTVRCLMLRTSPESLPIISCFYPRPQGEGLPFSGAA